MSIQADRGSSVFVSHSSKDAAFVTELCDLLAKHTAKTLPIFCASNGESVNLGKNWVSEIERGLRDARVTLIILTPESERSNWVHFEAGVSYARGARVVPIGFFGVDVSKVGPPLSLLQGYNVRGVEGLNNLIALVNQAFSYEFPEAFTKEHYQRLERLARFEPPFAIDPALDLIDRVVVELERENDASLPDSPQVVAEICQAALAHHDFESRLNRRDERFDSIASRGIYIDLYEDDGKTTRVLISVSPIVLKSAYPVALACARKLIGEELLGARIRCQGVGYTRGETEDHRILARLFDQPFRMGSEGIELDGNRLRVWHKDSAAQIQFLPKAGAPSADWIESTLAILIQRGVIQRYNSAEVEELKHEQRTQRQQMYERQQESLRDSRQRMERQRELARQAEQPALPEKPS